jgi:hypothetical protein
MALAHLALRTSGVLALICLSSQALIPVYAAATYSMTLQTDMPSYSGAQPIIITGVISPAPGPNTGVIITIKNAAGTVADINEVIPNSSDGTFSDKSVPGGSAAWTAGTFTVNATWGGGSATASKTTTFVYSPTPGSTTTTSSTTSTTSSTTSTTKSTTAVPITTTTTTTTSTVPEFPSSVLAIVALVGMALVALLSKRVVLKPAGSVGR